MIKEKYNRKKFLIDILYIAIILSLMSLIANIIELDLNFSSQVLRVIVFSLTAKLFIIYPITLLLSLVLASWGVFFIVKFRPFVFIAIQEKVMILYFNIVANLNGSQPIIEENKLFLYLIILGLISFFTAIIVYRIKNISFLIPVYLIIFLTYWYSFIDESYLFTGIFLFLFLILFGLKKYSINISSSKKTFNSWAATSIIYSLIIVIIAFFIPKPNDLLSWPSLQQKIYDIFPIVEDLRYYKDYDRKSSDANYFNFSTSGFSEGDSKLGGPLIQSQRKVMTVESDTPMYLRGKVKHIYTGKSWENMSYSTLEQNLNQDLSFLSDNEKDSFYRKKSATIKFDSFSSRTIFAPYKAEKISSDRNFTLLVNNDDIITTLDGTYSKESYKVDYLKPLPYEALVSNGRDKDLNELIDLDLLLQLPQYDDSSYTSSPQIPISGRTIELTSSIVENISNDYEKAIAIQNYLRDNYKYELDVPQLAKDKEFVDHFLFDQKEGYCTYYASAMVVMLRLEGIPARYVEGYIVDEKIEANKYQVRQKHAHAWVEAFIEPVGWTNFEPTAAYNTPRPFPEEEDEESKTAEDLPIADTRPDLPLEVPETSEEDIDISMDISQANSIVKTIIVLILLILLFLTLIRIFTRNLKYKKKIEFFKPLSNNEKVIYLYKDIVAFLEILGFSQLTGQTHFDYASKISYTSKDIRIQEIETITSLFVKIKYGGIEAKDEDVLKMIRYREELNEKIKNQLGKFNYFYRKYINVYFKKKNEIP